MTIPEKYLINPEYFQSIWEATQHQQQPHAMRIGLCSMVLELVAQERERQHSLFNDQTHLSPHQWMTVLVEEVGEAAKEACEGDYHAYVTELIQVAAVAVAMVEAAYVQNARANTLVEEAGDGHEPETDG